MTTFQNKWIRFLLIQLRDIALTFVLSVIITYFFIGNSLFTSFTSVFLNCLYGFTVGITIWKGNTIVGYYMSKLFPWGKKPTLILSVKIITAIIYTSLAIILVNIFFYEVFYKISIKSQFGRILIQMVVELGISMLFTTIFYLREFFIFWRKAVISEEKYKQEALSLQYETLKSYVNPHFLFNSLSVLSSLVEKDVAKSQLFIKQLSDIYRYVLEQKNKELVQLETELIFARSFIELHKIRHGENLKVEVVVDDKSGYIMPLSMQILLENTFKHNIISEEDPLEVKVWREDDYIIVQNKLQTRRTINQAGGIGLDTIAKRYAFFTPNPLVVISNNGFFTVKLPILDASVLYGFS